MGLMGTAGTLSIQFVLPIMGISSTIRRSSWPGSDAASKRCRRAAELDRILGIAAQTSFRDVAVLPAFCSSYSPQSGSTTAPKAGIGPRNCLDENLRVWER